MVIRLKTLLEYFPVLATISTFGIYIGSYPIRLEHLVLYSGFLFFFFIFFFKTTRITFPKIFNLQIVTNNLFLLCFNNLFFKR